MLTRSKEENKICKVRSITLGATLYPDDTHFKYPVVEEHNKDVEELVECLLHNTCTERLELLLSSRVIMHLG